MKGSQQLVTKQRARVWSALELDHHAVQEEKSTSKEEDQ